MLKEGGGGRVTELVARPLINLFYPELSGLIQPLAGEYAGRRSLLESIPFFTGYAVEIGHLIDAAERVGIEGLGQVDLERRVHRNQELEGLSRMSFVILQAVIKRLEERRKARLFAEMGSTMKLPRSGKGRLSLEVIELADQERPPMIRIPEYLERRRRPAGRGSNPSPVTDRAAPSVHDPRARRGRVPCRDPGLAALLVDAVDSGAGVNFLAGVTRDEAAAWWADRIDLRARAASISAFVALDDGERDRRLHAARSVDQPELAPPRRDRQGHRAPVGRRRGIATALMEAAEDAGARRRPLDAHARHRDRERRRRLLPVARLDELGVDARTHALCAGRDAGRRRRSSGRTSAMTTARRGDAGRSSSRPTRSRAR